MKEIRFYRSRGEYGFLSNLYECPIRYRSHNFKSAEAAYQYQKPRDFKVAEWLMICPYQDVLATSAHALLPRRVEKDWSKNKLQIMREVVTAKFAQNGGLMNSLLSTGDSILIEDSTTDSFWGIGRNRQGQNWLGRILMEVRAKGNAGGNEEHEAIQS